MKQQQPYVLYDNDINNHSNVFVSNIVFLDKQLNSNAKIFWIMIARVI